MNPSHDPNLDSDMEIEQDDGREDAGREGSAAPVREPAEGIDEALSGISEAEMAEAEPTGPVAGEAVPSRSETTGPAAGEIEPTRSEAALEAELERIQAESEANRERWLRAMAELENARKRFRRELETSINLANANLLRSLLDVVDNFDRALATVEGEEDSPAKAMARGIRLIYGQFMDVLRQSGLSRIEAQGKPFDPNLHEAIAQKETDEVPSHTVVEVVQEGYLLRDKVLRPARVVVAA
jgi:molecular chaperone GrpE